MNMKTLICLVFVVALLFIVIVFQKNATTINRNSKSNSGLEGYYQTDTFSNNSATINKSGQLSSTSENTSESWYIRDVELSSQKDFEISAHVSIDPYWRTMNKKNAQVGVGIFIAKKGDGGKLVFESDLCSIANDALFVQGQNIKNRLGGEPDDVVFKQVKDLSGLIKVSYHAKEKTFQLWFNDISMGQSKITSDGKVDWKMSKDDKFIVGIMGFSEHTSIKQNYPVIKDFKIGTADVK